MKLIKTLLMMISTGSGFFAAVYWYRSSIIEVEPPSPVATQTGDVVTNLTGHLVEVTDKNNKSEKAAKEAASLNKIAALLTGCSVLFATIYNLISCY